MSILKSLVAPIQNRMLQDGRCVACTRLLDGSKNREAIDLETELVICHCGRKYIYQRLKHSYLRATPKDLYQLPQYRQKLLNTES